MAPKFTDKQMHQDAECSKHFLVHVLFVFFVSVLGGYFVADKASLLVKYCVICVTLLQWVDIVTAHHVCLGTGSLAEE